MWENINKLISDARRKEILRLVSIRPMALAEIREHLFVFERNVTPATVRATLYNMCGEGLLTKHVNPDDCKNAIYRPGKPAAEPIQTKHLRGFAAPRYISADRPGNVAIMKAQPLRKLQSNAAAGSSLVSNIYE